MLGVVVALPWELKTLTRQAISVGTCSVIGSNLLVAHSGIGPQRGYAAAALLASRGATGLLSWGYAAALDRRLAAGSVLLPKRIIGAAGEDYAVSAEWHRQLHQVLSTRFLVATDPLAESVGILETASAKEALARRTQAISTDMESAAQARLAVERRLPFAVVRAVLDTAPTGIPRNLVQAIGGRNVIPVASVVGNALLHPTEWTAMIQLALQFKAARKSLKQIRQAMLDTSQRYLESLEPTASSRP